MLKLLFDYLMRHQRALESYFSLHSEQYILFYLLVFLVIALVIVVYSLIAWLILRINKSIFLRIEKVHGKKIHFKFAEKAINVVLIFIFVIIPLAGDKVMQSILGSAAVVTAVLGLAAQDTIKDILSGLLISLYKPFDIGNRIELEDGTAGIVETITMRHIVLILVDTVRLVIPNSKINSMAIRNMSYDYVPRSAEFTFPIHYDSDIALAKRVIYDAVKSSEFSIPGKKSKTGEMIYGPVYFISLSDSALNMKVTVYFDHGITTEVLKDDIHTRVFKELGNAGIKIPYPYTTVLLEQES